MVRLRPTCTTSRRERTHDRAGPRARAVRAFSRPPTKPSSFFEEHLFSRAGARIVRVAHGHWSGRPQSGAAPTSGALLRRLSCRGRASRMRGRLERCRTRRHSHCQSAAQRRAAASTASGLRSRSAVRPSTTASICTRPSRRETAGSRATPICPTPFAALRRARSRRRMACSLPCAGISRSRSARSVDAEHACATCSRSAASERSSPHLEVETYTWGVLPPALRNGDVGDDIARELQWVRAELGA